MSTIYETSPRRFGDFLSLFNDPTVPPPPGVPPVAGVPPAPYQQAPQQQPQGMPPLYLDASSLVAALQAPQQSQQQAPQPQPPAPPQPIGTSAEELAQLRRDMAARDETYKATMRQLAEDANARIIAWQIETEVAKICAQVELDPTVLDRTSMAALHASVPRAVQAFQETERFFLGRLSQRIGMPQMQMQQALLEGPQLAPYPSAQGVPSITNAPAVLQNPAPTPQQQGFVHPQVSHEAATNYAQFRQQLVQGRVVQPMPPGFVPPAGQFFQPQYPQAPNPYAPPAPVSYPQGYPTGPYVPPQYQQQYPQAPQYQQPVYQQPQAPSFYPNPGQQPGPQYPVHPGMPPGSPNFAPLPDPSLPSHAMGVPLSAAETAAAQEHARQVAQSSRTAQHRNHLPGALNREPAVVQAIGGGAPAPLYTGPAITGGDPTQHPMYRN